MKYRFSGHQTFAFRYGWLEKGVKAAAASPDIFTADDAIVQLGVGKNMVESIRRWCLATQMLEEKSDPADNKNRVLKPSTLAKQLLLKGGWDHSSKMMRLFGLFIGCWCRIHTSELVGSWPLVIFIDLIFLNGS